ncbi:glycine--tRNA ligase subunit beta [Fusobacterium gastrosuis]|uniref:glycine--tRNA ligase subunit beta n=1 Tax=Fusobacterium gastrosuis TaxID=1755100 RepID=UPI0029717D74|nr:glycine--tRNA ligase subunit beta [Fusobacteriaceae bacterium]MDY5714232.1 glycine--tRNA ligase subunit beta [Fusobacterium gastrosuis]
MKLLFEIGMEEIPARFLKQALVDLKNNLEKKLTENRISFEEIKTFGTPRRLILCSEISEIQAELNELNMGPSKEIAFKDGALTKAGLGFVKAQGVDEKNIEIVKTEKGEYIAVRKYSEAGQTKKVLPEILKSLVLELTFPKSMKWADKTLRFARPIEWFLALFGKEIVEFEVEGLKSSNTSKGHRFFGKDFMVTDVEEYFKKIRENNVIIDIDERKKLVEELIGKFLSEDEQVIIDKDLLDEVTNLVEYPYPIIGTFSEEFLEVPQEVLIISMQVHQRYFPILNKQGKLLPKFVVIRNGIDYSENVKKGNEKVLSARLSDARFFYHEDLKIPLDNNVEKLKTVVFQKDLGTIYAKMKRSEKIAAYLVDKLGYNSKKEDILRTVRLAKADLVSNMIGEKEFTKLQGFMGADYALKLGENDNVSLGIKEHYYPRFQGDLLPSGIEGIIAGISDRIDTLVGCFGVGLIPTGSKDPFALRRAALGIVNIIIASNISVSLRELVNVSLDALEADGVLKVERVKTETDVLEFFKQRIINVLSDMKYPKDIILSVVDRDADDIINCLEKVKVIVEYSRKDDFKKLLQTIKRVGNISKDNKDVEVNEKLFQNEYEKSLWKKSNELTKMVDKLLIQKDYTEYLDTVLGMANDIDKYFENTIVMDENKEVKYNRINQMTYLTKIFTKMAYLNNLD